MPSRFTTAAGLPLALRAAGDALARLPPRPRPGPQSLSLLLLLELLELRRRLLPLCSLSLLLLLPPLLLVSCRTRRGKCTSAGRQGTQCATAVHVHRCPTVCTLQHRAHVVDRLDGGVVGILPVLAVPVPGDVGAHLQNGRNVV